MKAIDKTSYDLMRTFDDTFGVSSGDDCSIFILYSCLSDSSIMGEGMNMEEDTVVHHFKRSNFNCLVDVRLLVKDGKYSLKADKLVSGSDMSNGAFIDYQGLSESEPLGPTTKVNFVAGLSLNECLSIEEIEDEVYTVLKRAVILCDGSEAAGIISNLGTKIPISDEVEASVNQQLFAAYIDTLDAYYCPLVHDGVMSMMGKYPKFIDKGIYSVLDPMLFNLLQRYKKYDHSKMFNAQILDALISVVNDSESSLAQITRGTAFDSPMTMLNYKLDRLPLDMRNAVLKLNKDRAGESATGLYRIQKLTESIIEDVYLKKVDGVLDPYIEDQKLKLDQGITAASAAILAMTEDWEV